MNPHMRKALAIIMAGVLMTTAMPLGASASTPAPTLQQLIDDIRTELGGTAKLGAVINFMTNATVKAKVKANIEAFWANVPNTSEVKTYGFTSTMLDSMVSAIFAEQALLVDLVEGDATVNANKATLINLATSLKNMTPNTFQQDLLLRNSNSSIKAAFKDALQEALAEGGIAEMDVTGVDGTGALVFTVKPASNLEGKIDTKLREQFSNNPADAAKVDKVVEAIMQAYQVGMDAFMEEVNRTNFSGFSAGDIAVYNDLKAKFVLLAAMPSQDFLKANDKAVPTVTLNGSTAVFLDFNQPYVESGAKAVEIDKFGTKTEISVVPTGTVAAASGTYTLTYQYTDAAGNTSAAVTRTVIRRSATGNEPTTPTTPTTPTAPTTTTPTTPTPTPTTPVVIPTDPTPLSPGTTIKEDEVPKASATMTPVEKVTELKTLGVVEFKTVKEQETFLKVQTSAKDVANTLTDVLGIKPVKGVSAFDQLKAAGLMKNVDLKYGKIPRDQMAILIMNIYNKYGTADLGPNVKLNPNYKNPAQILDKMVQSLNKLYNKPAGSNVDVKSAVTGTDFVTILFEFLLAK